MDYRNRNYYWIHISYFNYAAAIKKIKSIPSVKLHSAEKTMNLADKTEIGYYEWYHYLIGCNKNYSDALEYELRKMNRTEFGKTRFRKIDKNVCLQ